MASSPRVNIDIDITTRNLDPSKGIRASIVIRVERSVDEYITDFNDDLILTKSYQTSSPQYIRLNLTRTITQLQLFGIFHDQHQLSAPLSRSLAMHLFRVSADMGLGRNAFIVGVFVQITRDVFDYDVPNLASVSEGDGSSSSWSFDSEVSDLTSLIEEEKEEDMVERLVRESVINQDRERLEELEVEVESCSICLENLLDESKKDSIRMPCSHVFHDRCMSHSLRQKNSCPLCRRAFNY